MQSLRVGGSSWRPMKGSEYKGLRQEGEEERQVERTRRDRDERKLRNEQG